MEEQPLCNLSVKDLMEAGAHFGHQTRRWNPKMKLYIFEEKNGLYIINLAKTLYQLRKALPQVCKVIKENKPILFVGTKNKPNVSLKKLLLKLANTLLLSVG